jgi:hypothetical protein
VSDQEDTLKFAALTGVKSMVENFAFAKTVRRASRFPAWAACCVAGLARVGRFVLRVL